MTDEAELAEALGRTIRLLRIDRRIERKELATEAGISYSYLSAIENGTKTPSARLLYGLARALGVRDDELLAAARQRLAAGAEAGPPLAAAPSPAQLGQPAGAATPSPQAMPALPPVTAPPEIAAKPTAVTAAAPAPDQAAPAAPAAQAPGPPPRRHGLRRTSPRQEQAGRVVELAELLARLDPDDADAVIDLARRLADK